MINAIKGGHLILLRAVVHQPRQGCHRLHAGYKNETDKTSNSDSKNINNNYVTSYSASISSDFLM